MGFYLLRGKGIRIRFQTKSEGYTAPTTLGTIRYALILKDGRT